MTSGYDLRHVHTKITEEELTYHTLSLHLRARLVADKMADSVASFVRKQETFRGCAPQELFRSPMLSIRVRSALIKALLPEKVLVLPCI
jgi:hypothetical protein